MVVDGGRLRHKPRDLRADLMNAGLVLGVNAVGCCTLLAKVVNFLFAAGIAINNFAMPNKQLHVGFLTFYNRRRRKEIRLKQHEPEQERD